MKKIIFTEEFCQPQRFFPFTLTRQIQDFRVGIRTIREKWESAMELPSFDLFENDYKDVNKNYYINTSIGNDIIYLVHATILPDEKLLKHIKKLKPGQAISDSERGAYIYCISKNEINNSNKIQVRKTIEIHENIKEIKYPWDLLHINKWAIEQDIQYLLKVKKFQKPSPTNKVTGPSNIFIEKGAQVEHCLLNAVEGPIYISKGALVMEGSMIRGAVSVGENAIVKMGSRIYGNTVIGPGCTVGGEIKNSIFFGYSNKAHDGYIGDSIIGEWCNLGAGTSNSNIKNNASTVHVWNPEGLIDAGLKCGVLMGDYSRTAINTSINTGAVIGVCSNVYGSGLTPKFIPSFTWGSEGIERYDFEKALVDIDNWKSLKHQHITVHEKSILKHIFDLY